MLTSVSPYAVPLYLTYGHLPGKWSTVIPNIKNASAEKHPSATRHRQGFGFGLVPLQKRQY